MKEKTNKILLIYENFLKENNIYSKELYENTKKIINKCDQKKHLKCFCNNIYTKLLYNENYIKYNKNWRNYYLLHSIEYKIFLRFLKENNIYEIFMKNIYSQNNYLLTIHFINSAFIWSQTKEGYEFWKNYANLWNSFKDDCEKILNNIY